MVEDRRTQSAHSDESNPLVNDLGSSTNKPGQKSEGSSEGKRKADNGSPSKDLINQTKIPTEKGPKQIP